MHRRANAAVELAIPRHVRAESDGKTVDDDFADAAERVAGALDLVDLRDHPRFGGGVERAQRRRVGRGVDVRRHSAGRAASMPPRCTRWLPIATPNSREEALADGAGGDARGRLARRRALENVARVVAVVLEQSGEIGVAGTHARDGALAALGRTRGAAPDP